MDIHFDETRETGGDPIARLVELERILARLQAVQADLLVEAADPAPRVEEIYVLVPHSDEERLIRIADTVREEIACAAPAARRRAGHDRHGASARRTARGHA